jgi:hypothetical protein
MDFSSFLRHNRVAVSKFHQRLDPPAIPFLLPSRSRRSLGSQRCAPNMEIREPPSWTGRTLLTWPPSSPITTFLRRGLHRPIRQTELDSTYSINRSTCMASKRQAPQPHRPIQGSLSITEAISVVDPGSATSTCTQATTRRTRPVSSSNLERIGSGW